MKETTSSDARPARWRLLALLIAMTGISSLSLNILVPAIPSMVTKFVADPTSVQLTVSLYLLGLAMAQLVFGPLSDRFGRRPVVLAGLFGTENFPPEGPYGKEGSDDWKNLPLPKLPKLDTSKPMQDWIKPVAGKSLTFELTGSGGEKVTLVPLFRSQHQRMTIYWDANKAGSTSSENTKTN